MKLKTIGTVLLAALVISAGVAVAAPGQADGHANGNASAHASGDTGNANETQSDEHTSASEAESAENGSANREHPDENTSASDENADENASTNADDGAGNADDGRENGLVAIVSLSSGSGPDDNASGVAVNASGDASGVDVSAEARDGGDGGGPPISLPSNVPEHVHDIHVQIRDHVAGTLEDTLGDAISGLFGGGGDEPAESGNGGSADANVTASGHAAASQS